MKSFIIIFTILTGASFLVGCGNQVQYGSGAEYLARYQANSTQNIDPQIIKAANIEPNLQLPGRFGLARIVNGRLSLIPEKEVSLWKKLAAKHSKFGAFVPVSPLVAELTAGDVGLKTSDWNQKLTRTIQKIRLGAARQQLDAVLIYEVGVRSSKTSTVFALADLTIIGGAFLPTREITAEGRASAMLIDVRNGYPYGSANTSVDLSTYFVSWGSDRKLAEKRQEAIIRVVEKLIPEIDSMILKLKKKIEKIK